MQPNTLSAGVTYVFTLQANRPTEQKGSASITVVCNAAPVPGTFSVTPNTGTIVSMTDTVVFSASSFNDDDLPLHLFYRFEYEMSGQTRVLQDYSTASTFSTDYLPHGTLLPILKVKDAYHAERIVHLGCEAFTRDGQLATNSKFCGTSVSINVSKMEPLLNESNSDALDRQLDAFNPTSHSPVAVMGFLGSALGSLNGETSTSAAADLATRTKVLDTFSAIVDLADASTGAGVLQQLASNPDTLKDNTMRERLNNLTDTILAKALTEGTDSNTGTQLLETISSSLVAGKTVNASGQSEATKAASRIQQVALVRGAACLSCTCRLSILHVTSLCIRILSTADAFTIPEPNPHISPNVMIAYFGQCASEPCS